MSNPFQEQVSAGMAAWRSVRSPAKAKAGPMADKITLDCGLDGDGRQALGAYMRVVAARTATQGTPEAKLIASCVSAIGDKLAVSRAASRSRSAAWTPAADGGAPGALDGGRTGTVRTGRDRNHRPRRH